MRTILDFVLRLAATAAHGLLKAVWFVRRPKTFGAHAVALTPDERLVLVRLRYASGWRLPGGGRAPSEDPKDAALRELREEIGLTDHGEVVLACELEEPTDFKRDTASVVIVRDVRYRPSRWNWEVEDVREAPLDALPGDLSPLTARWLRSIRPLL
jgi:8-oxo-dGTP pyrophosphatase MutT (NUDIX family)